MRTYERIVIVSLGALFLVAASVLGVAVSMMGRADQLLSSVASVRDDLRAAREVRYEYKAVAFLADEAHSRTGADAGGFTTITPAQEELDVLTTQRWEIVTSYLETETAWPNFGSDRYVTGLQTNIRPQRLVFILRRVIGAAPAAGAR